MTRLIRWTLAVPFMVGVVGVAGLPSIGKAADLEVLAAVAPLEPEYAGGGIATCVDCHDETSDFPVLSILKTKHGVQADLRTPLSSEEGCETCHGPSLAHSEDDEVSPGIRFGLNRPSGRQNDVCMGCHQGGNRMNWMGSTHESESVPCVACHTIHAGEDPVLAKNTRAALWAMDSQAELCFGCHKEQQAKSHRLSSHPLKEGKASCSGCHNPHGSMGPSMLVKATVNETCFECHAEKRGPFLWEHAPVYEDCGNCHDPHGTNHRPMLIARGPWLCQQCHIAQYHPGTPYSGADVFPYGADDHTVARDCRNCHPEVHGSNHPSGVRWTR